jgi:hypothetical protein
MKAVLQLVADVVRSAGAVAEISVAAMAPLAVDKLGDSKVWVG